MQASMEIDLRPDGRGIDKAGEIGSDFFKSQGFSDKATNNQVMILMELIHNGIMYCNINKSETKITARIHIADNTITFEVMNPVDDTCYEQLKELDRTIQFIKGYQDPFEAYQLKQREVSQNSQCNGFNGLGLVKIASEGRADLDFFVSEDNVLSLYAIKNFDYKSTN